MTKDKVLRLWGESADKSVGLPNDDFLCIFANAIEDDIREACADMLSINRNEAQLMAGEMTSGEWRTLAAVLKGLQSLTRSNVRLVMKANNKE